MLENFMGLLERTYELDGGGNNNQDYANSFEAFFEHFKEGQKEMKSVVENAEDNNNYIVRIATEKALPGDFLRAALKQDNEIVYQFDYRNPCDYLVIYRANGCKLLFCVGVVADNFGGRKMNVLQRKLQFSDNSSDLSICQEGKSNISIRYSEKIDDETSVEYFYGTDKTDDKFNNFLNINFKNGKSYHVKLAVDFLIENDVFVTSIFRKENEKIYRVRNLDETELVSEVLDSLQDVTHLPLSVDYLLDQVDEKLANPESFPFIVYNMK